MFTLTAKAGQRVIGKNGQEYEVVVDPLTGKKYLKSVISYICIVFSLNY